MLPLVLAFLAAYLLGSIPTAYVLVKWTQGVDVRTVGSGNVGATNAARTAGKGIGAAVFAIDVLKGTVAVRLLPLWLLGAPDPLLAMACGIIAILGHNFPCFLKFQGGKGVATTIGVLLGAMPAVASLAVAVWLLIFAVTRYVSIASIAAGLVIPLGQAWTGQGRAEIVLGGALAWLILIRHRANLDRLLHGTEHRAGSRRTS